MMTNVGVLDAALRFVCGTLLLALGYGRLGVHLPGGLAWIVWIAGLLPGCDCDFPLLSRLRFFRYR